MSTIAQVSHALQTVLTTAAEAADARLHYSKRPDRAKFSASTLVQTLVFGWLAHPDATVEQLAQTAARVGVEVSPQAIDQRFTPASAELLRDVLTSTMQHALDGDSAAIPILQRFTGVFIHDSTTISLPDALVDMGLGCGGRAATGAAAALKCGVQLDWLTGAITALDLVSGRTHDSTLPCQHRALPVGSLRLAEKRLCQSFPPGRSGGGRRVLAHQTAPDDLHHRARSRASGSGDLRAPVRRDGV